MTRSPRLSLAVSRSCAVGILTVLACLAIAACGTRGVREATPLAGARQLVVVTSAGWDATDGSLRRFERDGDGKWRQAGDAVPVMLGRSGSAWGLGLHGEPGDGPRKREGDGRAPAGVFGIGTAFGYADGAITSLPYAAMDAGDWCIDVADSPLYNRIVNTRDVGDDAIEGSTEPMRRDLHADGDVRYKLGFVVEHNAAATPGGGSCIFAHLWRKPGETTAGCTAMAEPVMQELLAWLDAQRQPLFVLLPEGAYAEARVRWQLPSL